METIDHFKKYQYSELDYVAKGQRSCYTVGKVYRYKNREGFSQRYLVDGDLLLCIMKSGDCHYDFVRVTKTSETPYTGTPTYQLFAYFDTKEKVSCYGGMEDAFPKMEPLSPTDLVHVLHHGRVLIPLYATLSEDELQKMLQEKKWNSLKESYYEYVQTNGYVTPQDWIKNHKDV